MRSSISPRAVSTMTGSVGLALVQRGEHLEPAAPGKHHVEHDEIDRVTERLVGAGVAVERRVDLEPVRAQAALEEVDDSGLVLDDEDAVGHGAMIWAGAVHGLGS